MKAALIKLLASLMSNGENGKRSVVLVLSIAVGFLGLMFLPIAVLAGLGNVEPPEIDPSQFNESALFASLDSEQAGKITKMQQEGQAIADAMEAAGLKDQTIKAQLIYISYFDDIEVQDHSDYANMFLNSSDDVLIDAINSKYGLSIQYDDFMRTYTFIMNSTINEYMFSDETTKNTADLAAWAENAYVSGWGYLSGAMGERKEANDIRRTDNAGLILGYLNYDTDEKKFGNQVTAMAYTEQGELGTMPEVSGLGLFDGTQLGVYVGSGEVIFASRDSSCVVKQLVSEGSWYSWCTYDDIDYPQEVQDKIDELNAPEEDPSEEEYENAS